MEYKKIIGSCSSVVLHELFDSKCVGCIRKAVKVDKRVCGGKRCTSESFDSHGEHLQVTGSYPV